MLSRTVSVGDVALIRAAAYHAGHLTLHHRLPCSSLCNFLSLHIARWRFKGVPLAFQPAHHLLANLAARY